MSTTRKSRALGWLLGAVVLLLAAEGAAALYGLLRGEGLPYFRGGTEGEAPAAAAVRPGRAMQVSPYFGYARRPGVTAYQYLDRGGRGRQELERKTGSTERPAWADTAANNYGFFSRYDYPYEPPAEAFVIGLFGGSVAQWLALQGEAHLLEGLAPLGRPVVLLSFAHAGYKQPQQLLVLTHFLALGQRFDAVVELDGVNEAALGLRNEQAGVDASMPHLRVLRDLGLVAQAGNPAVATYLDELTVARAEITHLTRRRDRARLALPRLVDGLRLQRAQRRYAQLVATPPPESGDAGGLLQEVPPRPGQGTAERIAEDWLRASQLMAQLAAQHGAHYLHLLQPSQYYSGREFSPQEARIALHPKSRFRPGIEKIYPLLQQRGERLVAQGIPFLDATPLFDTTPDPVYSDHCCHYNQHGNDLLADYLAEQLLAAVEGERR